MEKDRQKRQKTMVKNTGKALPTQANQEDLLRHASARWWELRKGRKNSLITRLIFEHVDEQARLRMTTGPAADTCHETTPWREDSQR